MQKHPKNQREMRYCLRCGKKFMSSGIGNRICGRCKFTINESDKDGESLVCGSYIDPDFRQSPIYRN
jgi:ribosomal protein S27AE